MKGIVNDHWKRLQEADLIGNGLRGTSVVCEGGLRIAKCVEVMTLQIHVGDIVIRGHSVAMVTACACEAHQLYLVVNEFLPVTALGEHSFQVARSVSSEVGFDAWLRSPSFARADMALCFTTLGFTALLKELFTTLVSTALVTALFTTLVFT